jgi:hypothetical protein
MVSAPPQEQERQEQEQEQEQEQDYDENYGELDYINNQVRQDEEDNYEEQDFQDYEEQDFQDREEERQEQDFQDHEREAYEEQQHQQYEQQRQLDIIIMNISELLNQVAEVRGVQNKLNILKEVFNRLLTHKIIVEKKKFLRETIIRKIEELRENEVARLDIQFMNISQSLYDISIEYNNNNNNFI